MIFPKIGSVICGIAVICMGMSLFVLSAHLFADCMPKKWTGAALIKVHIAFIKFTLGPILSKIWLLANGILSATVGIRTISTLTKESENNN